MFWRVIATAAAVGIATWLVPGIVLAPGDLAHTGGTLLVVALLLALVNAVVKPIMKFLTSCLVVITFGLFLWVINAMLLIGVSAACRSLGVGWQVTTWGAAFIGSAVISLVSWALGIDRSSIRR